MKSYPHLREMSDEDLRSIISRNRDKVSVAERDYAYAAQQELDRRRGGSVTYVTPTRRH